MRPIVLFLVLFSNQLSAQINCSFSVNATYSFYSSGVVSYTNLSSNVQDVYVCGDGTIVYDTLPLSWGSHCRNVYLEENTTFYLKGNCHSLHNIIARTNATVFVLPGSTLIGFLHEPGASIVNPSLVTVLSNTCAALDFGFDKCITTGINSASTNKALEIFPSPANDYLNVKIEEDEFFKIEILNGIGAKQLIIEEFKGGSLRVNVSELPTGLYFIKLTENNNESTLRKFFVQRE